GVGLFLEFENLEATKQVAKAVLRESEIVVRCVVNGKQKPRRQQQLAARGEHAEDFVNRTLGLGKVLEHFCAEHDFEAGIGDPERLGVADNLHAHAALDVERDSAWEVNGVRPVL